ncbi:MAG: hypothetical protein ACTIAP_05030, partial [Cellulosimicrobium funkei]
LLALVASAPIAAAAVTVGVLAVAGLGVAGALGAFTPEATPSPTSQSSPTPSGSSPSPSPSPSSGTTAPTPDPTTDPTSPTNIPPAPTDPATPDATTAPPADGGAPGGTSPVGSTPTDPAPGGSAPVDPGTGEPTPVDPLPEPAPAALDVALGTGIEMEARKPADVRLTVSNSGGRAAQNVTVEVDLPAGVEAVTSSVVARGASVAPALRTAALPCGPAAAGGTLACAVGVLAPGEARDLVVTVTARGGGVYEFPARVKAEGLRTVERNLTPPPLKYVGAEVRLDDERVTLAANPGSATLTLTAANTGDRDAQGVRFTVPELPKGLSLRPVDDGWTCTTPADGAALECASDTVLPAPARGASAGRSVELAVELRANGAFVPEVQQRDDGALRVLPADVPVEVRAGADDQAVTASRTLSAAVPLAWLGADGVQVRAENADGTVRYTADVANRTGAPVTVGLAAPDTPAWRAADLPGRTSVGGNAKLVVDVNAPAVPASMLVLSQERLLVGPGGEAVVSRPPSDVALALDGQTIAPVVPDAAVAQCVFDPETDTSSAAATLTFDNSASTLPVEFSVDGHPGLAQTVPARARAEVELSPAGAAPATYALRADGDALVSRTVGAVDCFEWDVEGSATTRWSPETGSFVVEGTFRNDHAVAALSVALSAGRHGAAETVEVVPGGEASFAVDTGSRDVAAGSATFRVARVDAPGAEPHQVRASFDAARHAPSASRQPTVGACVFDPATDTSSAPVTLHLDNAASTVPVTFSVAGRDDLTATLAGGETRDVVVPGGVGAQGATFTVVADRETVARHVVDGVDCFEWRVEGSATAEWSPAEGGGSVVVSGTFRNDHAAATLRVALDGGELGTTRAVDVAPGAEAVLTLDTGSRQVAAGEVAFRVSRLDGSGRSHVVTAAYDAVRHAPAVDSPTVGACRLDPATERSSAPVALRYDNTRSTVPVVFAVAGRDDLTRTVDGGRDAVVDLPGGVGEASLTLDVLADSAALASHEVPGVDCFDWSVADGSASATATWVVPKGAGAGSTVVRGTFHNPYRATTLRVTMTTPYGVAAPVEVAPGATATLAVDTRLRDVPAGTATFAVERAHAPGLAGSTLTAAYAATTYAPSWARTATVEARWQDGSIRLVGTLTNDTAETLDARMLGGALGDSAPVSGIKPGETATFTIDTGALDVKAGKVTFRQYRWVLGKGFQDSALAATYRGAAYVPDWAATLTATTQCAPGGGGVVLTTGLRNDADEPTRVVVRTPFGTRDLGEVAPGASASVDLPAGTLAVRSGAVTFELSRTVLGTPFAETVTARFDALDCAVVAPGGSLVLGDPYYDAKRGDSFRTVSVLLDNAGSNVPLTFRVTGQAKGQWDLAAGERRTVALGEASGSGAKYVLHAGSWSEQLVVDPFSAAPACYAAWEAGEWYGFGDEVSYGGWNYTARIANVLIRPDRDSLGLIWQREARCEG